MTKRREYHPTIERVNELFDYDRISGLLVARVSRNRRRAGTIVGTLTSHGYLRCKFDKDWWFLHNLVWFIAYGKWPVADVDHMDGDKTNNSINNLRECTRSQNKGNSKRHSVPTKSGLKGVTWQSKIEKWQARLMVRGTHLSLGCYNTPEDAHAAYMAAAQKHFGEFARGG